MTLHPELPQNIEAERATLGSLITNRDAIVMVTNWLTPDMFYLDRHGIVYHAIQRLFARRTPPDLRTISDELQRTDQLEAIGGLDYLLSLSESVVTSYHVEYYAREVERCAVLRRLITAGMGITRLGYDASQDADTALGSAQKALADISALSSRGGLVPLSDLVDREYARLEKAANDDASAMMGCRTGLADLDDLTGGLQDQDLIILAARPSVGKSALMACLARGAALYGERDSLIFSLEMSSDQLTQRLTAIQSGIDSYRIRTLRMNEDDTGAFITALGKLSEVQIAIDDTPAVSVSYVRTAAFRHQAAHGRPLVIFVDYLQLMTDPTQPSDNRVQVVSAISRDLKALAKELQCPVVALSQLSRGVESRQSHVPMLSDLRESGSIEQDADIVLFIYREELYDKETDKLGIAELHIAKHRNGPVGVVPLRFDKATTKFDNLTYRTFGGPPWQP
jgi:replicative DNA helicase